MKKENFASDKISGLRKKAEEEIKAKPAELANMPEVDVRKLAHELQVHQVELEMQNDELRRSQLQLHESRDKYFEFYNMSPIGYVTLDKNGLILETNLTFASWVGVERDRLTNQPLILYIDEGDHHSFHLHLQRVLESGAAQICDIKIKGEKVFWVQLDSMAAQDSQGNFFCSTSVTNITGLKQGEEKQALLFDELKTTTAELEDSNAELLEKVEELERFRKATMDREERIIQLKKKLEELERKEEKGH